MLAIRNKVAARLCGEPLENLDRENEKKLLLLELAPFSDPSQAVPLIRNNNKIVRITFDALIQSSH